MKVFSMFSGVGGFEQAMPEDWKVVGLAEKEQYASCVLRYRFPDIKNWGDVTEIKDYTKIPDCDIIIGGVPCQAWSIVNRGRAGFDDIRGQMWFWFMKALESKQPKYFLAENVLGIVSHDKGNSFEYLLEKFTELGYYVDFEVVNAEWFLPQNRERVFILGIRKDFADGWNRRVEEEVAQQQGYQFSLFPDSEVTTIRDYLDAKRIVREKCSREILPPERKDGGNKGKDEDRRGRHTMVADYRIDEGLRLRNKMVCPCLYHRKHSETDMSTMPPLIVERDGEKIISIRRLMPIEAEKLMGWKENWTQYGVNEKGEKFELRNTERYKLCGNGVVTPIPALIYKNIKWLEENYEQK